MKLPKVYLTSTVHSSQVVVPDGLEHPKFKGRKSGKAFYLVCRRDAVPLFTERGQYKRYAPKLSAHSALLDQVLHLLRVRVLQEAELLANKLATLKKTPNSSTPILRRLTRFELQKIRETGVAPYPDSVAILVVPPPNKDPITRIRPTPTLSPLPLLLDNTSTASQKPLPPLSVLYPTHKSLSVEPTTRPHAKSLIPLYNGLSLFPLASQRALFHSVLTRILSVERRFANTLPNDVSSLQQDIYDEATASSPANKKASHAFLLASNGHSLQRVDVVPFAIALWRLRMFEGQGWDNSNKWLPA